MDVTVIEDSQGFCDEKGSGDVGPGLSVYDAMGVL
jgi:hypothetical protein